jgi:hypothetical protein
LDNWNKIEFIFAFKLHIPPSELERLEFYRIQYLIKEYEEHVQKENKEYEKQQKATDKSFKPPNMGDFKQPKFEMPKFQMPKY